MTTVSPSEFSGRALKHQDGCTGLPRSHGGAKGGITPADDKNVEGLSEIDFRSFDHGHGIL